MTENVMAGQAITRTSDHIYWFEGKDYPGATACLGVMEKPALVTWAANETAEACLALMRDDPRPMSTILAAIGDAGFRKAVTNRHTWRRDEAAQIGTTVHNIALEGGGRNGHGDAVTKRVDQYRKWWDASGWTKPLTEVIGVNPSVGYGGTIDILARDAEGRLTLADVKTGDKGVYREAILQLQAYADLTYIMLPSGELAAMPLIERTCLLHVTTTGVRVIEVTLTKQTQMAFLDCVDLYRWTKGQKGKL